jgi:hypothetical protein
MLYGKKAAEMLIKLDRKGSFVATDAALNRYEVVITEAGISDDNNVVTQQFLRTLDGKTVNRERKGIYVIADSGLVLRSSDPGCP